MFQSFNVLKNEICGGGVVHCVRKFISFIIISQTLLALLSLVALTLVLTCFLVILIVLVTRAPLSVVTYNKVVSLSRHVYLQTRMQPSFVNVSALCSCATNYYAAQIYDKMCKNIQHTCM